MRDELAHTVRILTADDRGVPLTAACECERWTWARPDSDTWADTLPAGARAHRADVAAARADALAAVRRLEADRRRADLAPLYDAALPADAPGAWIRRALEAGDD